MRALNRRVFVTLAALALLIPLDSMPAAAAARVPINDLGTGSYLGFQGGLYPNGSNAIPASHRAAGITKARQVRPLDVNGAPNPNGKYVLLSIGMSNTTQEFCSQNAGGQCASWSFKGQAAADPQVNHHQLVIVDGAKGGQTANTWLTPTASNYDRIRDTKLAPIGLSEKQVQVAWVKLANANPTVSLPAANADAYTLVSQQGTIMRTLKTRYPNIKLVFFSSRIYAGYATTTLNPEPYAYESAFGAKWVIQAQINQAAGGGIDPKAGNLNYNTIAPWLAWGPYLWADGLNPRSDGLTWARSDLAADGTHPSQAGQQKVGTMLINFFKASPQTACWFKVGGSCG